MKISSLLFLGGLLLVQTACEMPDVGGMNSMPKTTQGMSEKMDQTNQTMHGMSDKMDTTNESTRKMSEKMDTTNEAIRQQKLLLAVQQMSDSVNRRDIFPVPTGLMPAGKVFAETATAAEIVEYTYNGLKKIEENDPAYGIEEDGSPSPLSPQEKAVARRDKYAELYSLMIIAAFAPDETVEEIVRHDIEGHSRFQETGLAVLALRAAFLRDVLLKLSLKVDTGASETLNTSGKMREAIKYLLKLDRISQLKLPQTIQVKVAHRSGLIAFEEVQDEAGRKATAEMWEVALKKAEAGHQEPAATSANEAKEVQAKTEAVDEIRKHVISWKSLLK